MKKVLAIVISIAALVPVARAADAASLFQPLEPPGNSVTLRAVPAFGSYSGSYYDYYYGTTVSFTGGEAALWLSAAYTIPFFPVAYVGIDLGAGIDTGLVAAAHAGGRWGWRVLDFLDLSVYAQAAAWYMASFSSVEFVPSVGLDLSYRISPVLAAGLHASAMYSLAGYSELYLGASLSYRIAFGTGPAAAATPPAQKEPAPLTQEAPAAAPAGAKGGLQLSRVSIADVYPVFYKYYDDHPVGKVTLHNAEKATITNVRVSLMVKEYMSDPKESKGPDAIAAGGDATVDVYALFRKDILSNTEDTKVSAAIAVTYVLDGKEARQEVVRTITVLKRTALTWDDDRKAAAFVSPNDPTIQRFANNVAAAMKGKGNTALEPNIRMAAAIHAALTQYGLTYVTTPVATLNSDNTTVDTIRFPPQTLENRSGKCSDFSVLYASLLEAVGIRTAFITIPGHIYLAFALTLGPDEARAAFTHRDDLIYTDTAVWLPLEITLRDGGFLKAWQLGAKEWRENLARKQAVLYPLEDAWSIYKPVGFAAASSEIRIPADDQVVKAANADLDAFVKSEMGAQEAVLAAAVTKATTQAAKSRALNSLAILHSRYGLYDQALGELSQVFAKDEYPPALVNAGNIWFVRGDVEKALEYYNRAAAKSPKSPAVLLAVARANHALENYATARKAYADLKTVSPDLAQEYAYLDLRGEEATRAADEAGVRLKVEWAE